MCYEWKYDSIFVKIYGLYWPSYLLPIVVPIAHRAYWLLCLLVIVPIGHHVYLASCLKDIVPIGHQVIPSLYLSAI